jgi:hypothetical protein
VRSGGGIGNFFDVSPRTRSGFDSTVCGRSDLVESVVRSRGVRRSLSWSPSFALVQSVVRSRAVRRASALAEVGSRGVGPTLRGLSLLGQAPVHFDHLNFY